MALVGNLDDEKPSHIRKQSNPAKLAVEKAVVYAREWILAQATGPKPARQPSGLAELPPIPPDVVHCDVDGAWLPSQRAGFGWCFKQTSTHLYMEGAQAQEFVSSPLMAEALAMRTAIRDAHRKSLLNVWFRTDNQELARAINSKTYSVELFGVLMDIELLSSSFAFFLVSFFGRENNVTADSLAKAALRRISP